MNMLELEANSVLTVHVNALIAASPVTNPFVTFSCGIECRKQSWWHLLVNYSNTTRKAESINKIIHNELISLKNYPLICRFAALKHTVLLVYCKNGYETTGCGSSSCVLYTKKPINVHQTHSLTKNLVVTTCFDSYEAMLRRYMILSSENVQ